VRVRLSSRGQLVIPRAVRRRLNLSAGSNLNLEVVKRKIILKLSETAMVDSLYGRYAGADLLSGLEEDHLQELLHDHTARP